MTKEDELLLKDAFQQEKDFEVLIEKSDYQKAIKVGKSIAAIFQKAKKWEKLIAIRCKIGNAHSELANVEQSRKYLQATLELGFQHLPKEDVLMGEIYYELGYLNAQICKDPSIAMPYFQKTLTIWKEKWGYLHYKTATVINSMGYCHWIKADFERALSRMKESLAIQQQTKELKKENISSILNNIGSCYYLIGNYETSLMYMKKALAIRLELREVNTPKTAMYYQNIGAVYVSMKELVKALSYMEKALEMRLNLFGETHPMVAATLNQMGNILFEKEEYATCLLHNQRALDIFQKTVGEKYLHTGTALQAIATVYMRQKDMQNAIVYFHSSLKAFIASLGEKHNNVAKAYKGLSYCFFWEGQYNQAFDYIQKALQALFSTPISTNVFDSLPLVKNEDSSNAILLKVLLEKGNILFGYYVQKQTTSNVLKAVIDNYSTAQRLIEQIRKSYRTENSKLLFSADILEVYAKSVKVGASLQNLSDFSLQNFAFVSAEKAKSVLLLGSIQENEAKTAVNISTTLLQKEKRLKVELTYLEKSIQKEEAKGDKKNEASISKWEESFFNFHQEYIQLLQQLEVDYPDYYQLKYDTQAITPMVLQSTLEESQILISYFIGEKSIYIFVFTSNEFEVEEIKKPDDFEGMIQRFLKSIHAHAKADYLQLAYELYELLIAPVELCWYDGMSDFLGEEVVKSPQQLIVIPHAELSYLPFEALISEQVDENDTYQELSYLVQNYNISYHYSATLWQYAQQNKGTRADTKHSFVGFAPVYEVEVGGGKYEVGSRRYEVGGGRYEVGGRRYEVGIEKSEMGSDALVGNLNESAKVVAQWATRSEALQNDGTWTPLPHSKEETENIAALFEEKGLSSEIYLHERATKEQFQDVVGKAQFILVAAHGMVNDEKTALSGLVFYPNKVVKNSPTPERFGDIWNGEERQMSPSFTDVGESSQTDNILSMNETYHLDLQADLVVLSSCESGIGTLHKGEGMMAVNRGFLVAGAKNVISTLFKVYDRPSSLLTQYLFAEILEGADYTSALRKAKLELLALEGVSPKSWCGFVLIGG